MTKEQCCECSGKGEVREDKHHDDRDEWIDCEWCGGKGWVGDD